MGRKKTLQERLLLDEVSTWTVEMQETFAALRKKGNTIVMAHMLACRKAPACMTDDVFMTGQVRIKDMADGHREFLCNEIVKNGGTVCPDDTYMPGMANKIGDPEAVCGFGDGGESFVRKLADKRGVKTIGPVEHDGRRNSPDTAGEPVHRLHPRIVERKLNEMLTADPSLKTKDQRELREGIIEKHSKPK